MRVNNKNIEEALEIAFNYGKTEGSHHKSWVIDQMVRKLTGSEEEYIKFMKEYCIGEDGVTSYEWSKGIAP
jgi:hypothetical protein